VLRDKEAEGDRCKDKWGPLAKETVTVKGQEALKMASAEGPEVKGHGRTKRRLILRMKLLPFLEGVNEEASCIEIRE
jgi:hypothetical protein